MTNATPKKREWKPSFLDGLREHGNVTKAAKEAGISRGHAYHEKNNLASFAANWDEAIEEFVDSLEHELYRRAKDGSDTLLIFALKGRRSVIYGDRVKQEVSGPGGGPVPITTVEVVGGTPTSSAEAGKAT